VSPRSHESWKEELPSYLLGALSPGEKADLEHHLGGCAECQAELLWLEPARGRLVEMVEQVEPSPGLKNRVMAAVEADLEDNPVTEAPPLAAPAPEPPEAKPARTETSRFGRFNFGQLLRPATLGSLAVVLFIGVIAGYVISGGDDESPAPAPTVAERTIPMSPSVVGGADATLVATGNSGTLKITNLKKLEDGEVYQAWIQRGQSIVPTDSLFTPRKDGTATASIPDLNGVSAVMVSAEPKGGSEQPTTAPIITIEMPS